MVDIVSRSVRSRIMSRIRGRNTAPEITLRRALHSFGLRYRLHVRELPGTPDLVFRRFRAVVFVHGCFWHRHPGCRLAAMPETRREFWEEKFRATVERDRKAIEKLLAMGWRVAIVWECAIGKTAPPHVVDEIMKFIGSECSYIEIPQEGGKVEAVDQIPRS